MAKTIKALAFKPNIHPNASDAFERVNSGLDNQTICRILSNAQNNMAIVNRALFNALKTHASIGRGKTAMDVGSDLGNATLSLQQSGASVTCVDGSLTSLHICQEFGLGARHVQRDLETGQLPQMKHDFVISTETLKYLQNPHHALEQMIAALEEGGIMGLSIDLRRSRNAAVTGVYPSPDAEIQADIYAHPAIAVMRQIENSGGIVLENIKTDFDAGTLAPHNAAKHLLIVQKPAPAV